MISATSTTPGIAAGRDSEKGSRNSSSTSKIGYALALNFELPHGGLIFSGMALVPQVNHHVNIDGNCVTGNSNSLLSDFTAQDRDIVFGAIGNAPGADGFEQAVDIR